MAHEKHYEKVYQALESVGEGGLTIAGLAREIGRSKSLTWNVVNEMAQRCLVDRRETATGNVIERVTYHYFQLSLFHFEPVIKGEVSK